MKTKKHELIRREYIQNKIRYSVYESGQDSIVEQVKQNLENKVYKSVYKNVREDALTRVLIKLYEKI